MAIETPFDQFTQGGNYYNNVSNNLPISTILLLQLQHWLLALLIQL
jgi:hypothetical protein